MYIPLYPRGRPASPEISAALDELFILADVDTQRSIEPPMSGTELAPDCRPSDEVLQDRFINHARRSLRYITESKLLVIPWRIRADHALKRTLMQWSHKLDFRIETGSMARHILVVEDPEAVVDFEEYVRRDGAILGKLHQGGIWWTEYGRFFLVSWYATVVKKVLAARLKNLLTSDRSFPMGEKQRSSMPPMPPVGPAARAISASPSPLVGTPSRRPSTSSFRAVQEPSVLSEPFAPSQKSPKRRP